MKRSLEEISKNYHSDKGSVYHNYLEIYEKYFSKYRNTMENFLEIGLWQGDSIRMWRDYFNTGNLVGADILDLSRVVLPNTQIHICDQSDRNQLGDLVDNSYDEFDIIIDDGPHTLETMSFFLTNYLPCLKSGGILIVEDIIDCNWTQELLQLLDPTAGKITRVDMRGKQKTKWHSDRWAGGLDVIVFEKF
jgi:hypothetical protein